ncbi:hypothetical protein OWM54_27170 [Myxococcus sp. MISCRS1]|uniref:hypothetical protein n=1 Tax=Myxococcus sp. MISCRS1 TaxID=2996786 RepID=UPI0022719269|nr:hypothetical protein [Myxococcus sp. MISCRS1]MCY1000837.1 hypothetical protein [Myxococcus sp. MISCRS1]
MTSVVVLSVWLLLGTPPPVVEAAAPVDVATAATAVKAPTGYRDASGSVDSLAQDYLRVTVRRGSLKPQRGYWAAEVTLHNGDAQPHPVHLSFRPSYGDVTHAVERTVELAPRQRLVTWLMAPVAWHSGALTVEVPGLPPITEHLFPDNDRFEPVLVVGNSESFEAVTGLTKTPEQEDPLFSVRFIDAQEAPRELAAYAGFEMVVLTETATKVPADVWAVLESYALSGGRLVVANPPRDLRERLQLLQSVPLQDGPYAFGGVWTCDNSAATCRHKIQSELSTLTDDNRGKTRPQGLRSRWASKVSFGDDEAPLLGTARAPVGPFLLLMTAFALLVGPGAWWLTKRRGPVAVLIAVPAVSLVTCLVLIAWSVLVDGFAVHTARYSLTYLDGARARAVTVGLSGWYANLSPEPLRLPSSSVLIAPHDTEDLMADLDWTGGLTVGDGFLPPRTYREWGELAVVPSRARLVLVETGGEPKVQNALGVVVEEGVLRWNGQVRRLPRLADGEEGALGAAEPDPGPSQANAADTLVEVGMPSPAQYRLQAALPLFRRELKDKEFVVRTSGPGPLPTSALSAEVEASVHLIRGEVRP